ncbi:MAG: sugar ABC transporter permease [Bacteroidota bacterium]
MNKTFLKNIWITILILPSLVILIAVVVYPFGYNFILSLSNISLTHIRDWKIIGFDQYIKVFTTVTQPNIYVIFFKTILWTITNLFFHVVIGVSLALVLNQKDIFGKAIFRTILILPWAVPQLIVALTWRGMFNYEYGVINAMLTQVMGLPPVEWLKGESTAFLSAIITNVWLGFPFMMIIALGALQSIPRDMYEAADIDGANWYHRFRYITVPLLKPVMIPAITLGTIWTFNNLNIVWLISNGGEPQDSTHILVSFVYKAAFNFYRYGYAAALSVIIFLILLLFSLSFMKKTRTAENVY